MPKPLYSAYLLSQTGRKTLMDIFKPKYSRTVAHHVTVQFGNVTEDSVPDAADIEVVGYIDSGDGLEALVVSVNGAVDRPDGSVYHITWSLQNGYKPVDSNKVIKKYGYEYLVEPISIETIPQVVMSK